MHLVRHLKILALAAVAAASSLSSSAAPVTYWFSGVVDSFRNASNTAPAGVGIGTPFVGRISYDPNGVWFAQTNNSGGGAYSQYHYTNLAALSFTVYIAGHSISNTAFFGRSGQIIMENNVSSRDRSYVETSSALTMNGTNMVVYPNQAAMVLDLYDKSATALNSTGLPLTPPTLSQFSDGAFLTISARNPNGTLDLSYIRGRVSVITTDEMVMLSLRRLDMSKAQIAWPLWASGYTLQSASNLTKPDWQDVAAPVADVGQEHTVSVSTFGSPKFYRLRK